MHTTHPTITILASLWILMVSPAALAQSRSINQWSADGRENHQKVNPKASEKTLSEPSSVKDEPLKYREDFTGKDVLYASLAGTGSFVGAGVLSFVFLQGGTADSLGGVALVLAGGLVLVAPAGVAVYGDSQGFDGSYAATVGGAFLGAVAGGVLGLTFAEAGASEGLVLTGVLAPLVLGPVVGYYLSLDRRPTGAPLSSSLLDYRPGDGLRLGVPAIGFTNDNDDRRVQVSLLSGTF